MYLFVFVKYLRSTQVLNTVMEWSNEKVITFLEILQTEPCLWDPRLKSFKNRRLQNDAWRRIMELLPFKTTIEQMKKKKESLMGYYRTHLHKYRKSLDSDSEAYKTNWFAYERMDSFLREVYDSNSTVNTAINEDNEVQDGSEGKHDGSENSSHLSSEIEKVLPNIHEENRARPREKKCRDSGRKRLLREGSPPELREAQCHMDEAFVYTQEKEDDECEIFGRLIASKLQKIRNLNTRDILMNDIHNLVFRACMADRREHRSQLSTFQSPHDPLHSSSQSPPSYQALPNSTASQPPRYEVNSPSPRGQFSLCSVQSSQENFSELVAARASPIVITVSDKIKIEE